MMQKKLGWLTSFFDLWCLKAVLVLSDLVIRDDLNTYNYFWQLQSSQINTLVNDTQS